VFANRIQAQEVEYDEDADGWEEFDEEFKDEGLDVFSVDEVLVFLVAAAVVAALVLVDERVA